jgi:HEAT repeat protein
LNAYLEGYQTKSGHVEIKDYLDSSTKEFVVGNSNMERIELFVDTIRCEALFDGMYDRESEDCGRACSSLSWEVQKTLTTEEVVPLLFHLVEEASGPVRRIARQRLYAINERSQTDILEPMFAESLESPEAKHIQTLLDLRGRQMILQMSALAGAASSTLETDKRNLDKVNSDNLRLKSVYAQQHRLNPKEDVLQIVVGFADDDRWWVRRWAVEVMKDSKPHCIPELLEQLRNDSHPVVREAAQEVDCEEEHD